MIYRVSAGTAYSPPCGPHYVDVEPMDLAVPSEEEPHAVEIQETERPRVQMPLEKEVMEHYFQDAVIVDGGTLPEFGEVHGEATVSGPTMDDDMADSTSSLSEQLSSPAGTSYVEKIPVLVTGTIRQGFDREVWCIADTKTEWGVECINCGRTDGEFYVVPEDKTICVNCEPDLLMKPLRIPEGTLKED
ncbi:MAG: hypothetical protein Q9221_008864 [Calogaya cf. arnoldii]